MMKYYIAWLPAILAMAVIFYFSSKPAEDSAESSLSISDMFLKAYEVISDIELEGEEREEKLSVVDHVVRKSAHFMEYAILCAAITLPLWIRKYRGAKLLLLAVITTVLYASTDEFHQLFVPGRSGELKDVLIDTAGAVFGSLLFLISSGVLRYKKDIQPDSITP